MPKYNYPVLAADAWLEKQKYMSGGYSMGTPTLDPRRSAYYGSGGGYPTPPTPRYKAVEDTCSICAVPFFTSLDTVIGTQEDYLCPHCKENYGKNPILEGIAVSEGVEELLQEAEDHFNGVVRPKKVQPPKEPTFKEMREALEKPVEVKNPFQDALDKYEQDKQDLFSRNQESRSQDKRQNPKKNNDWWKILGIIIITAVVTAFFTALLI